MFLQLDLGLLFVVSSPAVASVFPGAGNSGSAFSGQPYPILIMSHKNKNKAGAGNPNLPNFLKASEPVASALGVLGSSDDPTVTEMGLQVP